MPRAVADHLPFLKVVHREQGEEKAHVHAPLKERNDRMSARGRQRANRQEAGKDHGHDQRGRRAPFRHEPFESFAANSTAVQGPNRQKV